MPPRRRDRRNHPPPDRRYGSDHPGRDSLTESPAATARRFPSAPLIVFSLAFFLVAGSLTVYRGNRHSPAPATSPALSVYERGLVKRDVSFQEILTENGRVSENKSGRHFPNPVLAYITPWNSRGYEIAKLFNSKLTHLSPVWYDLKSEGKKLVLEGRHNADIKWISEIRMNGHSLVHHKPELLMPD